MKEKTNGVRFKNFPITNTEIHSIIETHPLVLPNLSQKMNANGFHWGGDDGDQM